MSKTLILEIDIVSLRKLHEDLERMRNDSHPWVGMLVRQLDEGNANRIKVVIDDFGRFETFTLVESYE